MSEVSSKLKEMFPDLELLSSEDVKGMSSSELEKYIKRLKDAEENIKYKEGQLKAKLESLQEEKEKAIDYIKDNFDVDNLEDLEELRDKSLKELDKKYKELEECLSE